MRQQGAQQNSSCTAVHLEVNGTEDRYESQWSDHAKVKRICFLNKIKLQWHEGRGRKEWCVHMMYIIWMMHYKEMRNKNCTNLFCNTAQPICMSIRAASRSVWAAWQVLPYFVGSVVLKIENLTSRSLVGQERYGGTCQYPACCVFAKVIGIWGVGHAVLVALAQSRHPPVWSWCILEWHTSLISIY